MAAGGPAECARANEHQGEGTGFGDRARYDRLRRTAADDVPGRAAGLANRRAVRRRFRTADQHPERSFAPGGKERRANHIVPMPTGSGGPRGSSLRAVLL